MRAGLPDIVMGDGCRHAVEAGGVGGAEGRAGACVLAFLRLSGVLSAERRCCGARRGAAVCMLVFLTSSWVMAAGIAEIMAESAALRGAQRSGRTLPAQEAAAALDAALMQESESSASSVPVELRADM